MIKLSCYLSIIPILLTGIFISCKKESDATDNKQHTNNRPPVANAGFDQAISLPADTLTLHGSKSITLDGSKSTDPDKNIASYLWTKISGPSSLIITIADANAMKTQVTGLMEGVYQFELKVTDAEGLFSKDTVMVTLQPPGCDNSDRPIVNAQLIPVGMLSQPRGGMAVASAGNKILFAGGSDSSGNLSSRVDIYDITTNTWSTAELSVGRYDGIGAAANGNKIFFAGGEFGDGTWPVDSVDIYDIPTNTWTVSHLSCAGHSITAAAIGNKVVFAGGDPGFNHTPGVDRTRQVDIYDLTTALWSAIQLSDIRAVSNHQVVVANNKIYFSGFTGTSNEDIQPSNEIEVYDITTGTWSVDHLQAAQSPSAGIAVGNKIFWVDVTDFRLIESTCLVEIRDVVTNTSSIQYLHKPASSPVAVAKDNKVLIFRMRGDNRDKFDIYDTITGTWSIGVLTQPIPGGASIISVNNTIYVAGGVREGILSGAVYKLEF